LDRIIQNASKLHNTKTESPKRKCKFETLKFMEVQNETIRVQEDFTHRCSVEASHFLMSSNKRRDNLWEISSCTTKIIFGPSKYFLNSKNII